MCQVVVKGIHIADFRRHLISEEKSVNTLEKYLRDVTVFAAYLSGREVTKELSIAYKQQLIEDEYGYWFVSVDKLQQTAERVLGFKSDFPDELYWNYETEAIWAYRFGTDYCISIPAGIDGVYGTMTTKVNRYEPMADGRYQVFCTVTTTLDDYVDGVDDYTVTAGFREIDGDKFWTIYAFDAV